MGINRQQKSPQKSITAPLRAERKDDVMTALKPCPFCGLLPNVSTKDRRVLPNMYEPGVVVQQRVVVQCPRCFCKMDVLCEKRADDGMGEKAYRYLQKQMARDAIANLWNRRAVML